MSVTYLEISYPNFTLGSIINPDEANQNNYDFTTKINDIITNVNLNESNIATLTTVKADITYVNSEISKLAGTGRTTETVRQNAVNLTTHKTSADHDSRYYTKTLIDDKINVVNGNISISNSNLSTHKLSSDHDSRYYTKTELAPWLRQGDTSIREEVFSIVNPNNGDGTFTYSQNGKNIKGTLTPEGYQVFNLTLGQYILESHRLEVTIDDTLRRSVASGGIIETSPTSFALTQPEGTGAEITAKYYERIGLAGEYNIRLGSSKPPLNEGRTMWFEVIA